MREARREIKISKPREGSDGIKNAVPGVSDQARLMRLGGREVRHSKGVIHLSSRPIGEKIAGRNRTQHRVFVRGGGWCARSVEKEGGTKKRLISRSLTKIEKEKSRDYLVAPAAVQRWSR